jgi:putative transposase
VQARYPVFDDQWLRLLPKCFGRTGGRILKTELVWHRTKDAAEAAQMVDQSVRIYNSERPDIAPKYKTPDAVRRAFLG